MLQLSDMTLEDIFLRITMGDEANKLKGAEPAAAPANTSEKPKFSLNVKDGELVAEEVEEEEKLLVDQSFDDPDEEKNEGGEE
jgi:ABC-2 type transport system ATP-binding protein